MPTLSRRNDAKKESSLGNGLLDNEHSPESNNLERHKENLQPAASKTGISALFQRLRLNKAKQEEASQYQPPGTEWDISNDSAYLEFKRKGLDYTAKKEAIKDTEKRDLKGP